MFFIADFHIHSKYSRATSPQMEVDSLSWWAEMKGINLIGTGDFTHPGRQGKGLKSHLRGHPTPSLPYRKGYPGYRPRAQ